MNATSPVHFHTKRKPSLERTFRQALTDPKTRAPLQEAMAWDDSQVSRFLSGGTGITIDKIDAAINVLNQRVVSKRYLDAIGELCITGASCYCAREGLGECGME